MVWLQHLQRSVGVAGCPWVVRVCPWFIFSCPPRALAATSCPGSHPCPPVPCLDIVVQLLTLPHTVPSPHTPWTLLRLNSDGWGLPSVPNYVQSDISLILKEVTFLGRNDLFTVPSPLLLPVLLYRLSGIHLSYAQKCFWLFNPQIRQHAGIISLGWDAPGSEFC